MPGVFNGPGEAALAERAGSRFAAGSDFCLRVYVHTQKLGIFIIDVLNIIYTKMTLFHLVRSRLRS